MDARSLLRCPVESGKDSGERPGKIRHAIGDHWQAERRKPSGIAIAVGISAFVPSTIMA